MYCKVNGINVIQKYALLFVVALFSLVLVACSKDIDEVEENSSQMVYYRAKSDEVAMFYKMGLNPEEYTNHHVYGCGQHEYIQGWVYSHAQSFFESNSNKIIASLDSFLLFGLKNNQMWFAVCDRNKVLREYMSNDLINVDTVVLKHKGYGDYDTLKFSDIDVMQFDVSTDTARFSVGIYSDKERTALLPVRHYLFTPQKSHVFHSVDYETRHPISPYSHYHGGYDDFYLRTGSFDCFWQPFYDRSFFVKQGNEYCRYNFDGTLLWRIIPRSYYSDKEKIMSFARIGLSSPLCIPIDAYSYFYFFWEERGVTSYHDKLTLNGKGILYYNHIVSTSSQDDVLSHEMKYTPVFEMNDSIINAYLLNDSYAYYRKDEKIKHSVRLVERKGSKCKIQLSVITESGRKWEHIVDVDLVELVN